LLIGIIQNPTLWTNFPIKINLPPPGFCDVISKDRFKLIMKFLHFANNTNKQIIRALPTLYKIFPVLSHPNDKFKNFFLLAN
jgi:hypothetical protein